MWSGSDTPQEAATCSPYLESFHKQVWLWGKCRGGNADSFSLMVCNIPSNPIHSEKKLVLQLISWGHPSCIGPHVFRIIKNRRPTEVISLLFLHLTQIAVCESKKSDFSPPVKKKISFLVKLF